MPAIGRKTALLPTFENSIRAPYRWEAHHDVEVEEKVSSVTAPQPMLRLVNYTHSHEALTSGKVMAIATYMEWRSLQCVFWYHYYFPIQFVSVFREGARILQAYHDGETLHISKSKVYDFSTDDNEENYKLYARWLFDEPCGDTTTPLPIKGKELEPGVVQKLEKKLNTLYEVE